MPIAAHDPVEAVLSQADKNGMQVFVAVGLYAWFDFTQGSLEWHKKVAAELWKKYGHHPSFYGWYVSEEMDGGLGNHQQSKDIVTFFRKLQFFVHNRRLTSPSCWPPTAITCEAEESYQQVTSPTWIFFVLLVFTGCQRLTLPVKKQPAYFKITHFGFHSLWMDMEVFDFAPDNGRSMPRSIKGLLSDSARGSRILKNFLLSVPRTLNSPSMSIQPGGEKTVKLFLDYKKIDDRLPEAEVKPLIKELKNY